MSGFGTAFTTLALAGIGDKSFLIALVFSAKHKARWVFLGSFLALILGSIIWIALGVTLKNHIDSLILGIVSSLAFISFGIYYIANYLKLLKSDKQAISFSTDSMLQQNIHTKDYKPFYIVKKTFASTFVAEFGDRTQLTLLLLATAPGLVFTSLLAGAFSSQLILTIAAVGSGKWFGSLMNEKMLALVSGIVFLILGIQTLIDSIQ